MKLKHWEAILEVYSIEEILELNDTTPAEILKELWDQQIILEVPPTPVVFDDE